MLSRFNKISIKISIALTTLLVLFVVCIGFASSARAEFNKQINYQGKLADSLNVSVVDGYYSMRFRLYTSLSGGSPIWTEEWCNTSDCRGTGAGYDNRVKVTNGLFSVMLGSTTALTDVDFNQTLYLGVEIGGPAASTTWDGEMSPRKILGAVPAAFTAATSTYALSAETLQNIRPGQFVRSDVQNATSTSSTFISVLQSGAGKIAEFFGTASKSVLSLLSDGNVGVGTTSPSSKLAIHANNGETNTRLFTVASSTASATTTLFTVLNSGNVGIGTTSPAAPLHVDRADAGTILKMTLGGSNRIDFSVNNTPQLQMTQPTGNFTLYSAAGTITRGGSGNLDITFNPLNAGNTIVSSGNFGIGTTSPFAKLSVQSTAGDSTPLFAIASSTNGAATSTVLMVAANGYVGVGTSSPSQALSIQGNGFFSGNILAGTSNSNIGSFTMDTMADITMSGLSLGDNLGTSVALAGDVNGDGYNDVIAGAVGVPAGGAAGAAYIYFGGPAMDNVADLTISGSASYMGISVDSAGDVNGDGYNDVVVADFNGAYVYYGGATMDNVADVTLSGSLDFSNYFDDVVASAGDVNRDGYGDVLFAADGNVYLYYGGVSMNNVADVTFVGTAGTAFGSSIEAADLNSDGYNDVIVGSYGYSASAGATYVYFGDPNIDNTADFTLTGPADSFFGNSVSAGDINGDGFVDLSVGAYNDVSSAGRVYVYYGGPSLNSVADVTITGSASSFSGSKIDASGDLNNDGFNDLIVATEETGAKNVRVYYGGPSMDTVSDITFSNAISNFASAIDFLGDINGDGFNDVLVGANESYTSGAGAVFIYKGSGNRFQSVFAQSANVSKSLEIGMLTLNNYGLNSGKGLWGINTPNWQIDRSGTASFQGASVGSFLSIGTTSTSTGMFTIQGSGNNDYVTVASSTGSSIFKIKSDGNVGIGTSTPFAKLSIHANDGENNTALFNISSSTAAATSSLLTVLNNGNVGIGTMNPLHALQVNGKIAVPYNAGGAGNGRIGIADAAGSSLLQYFWQNSGIAHWTSVDSVGMSIEGGASQYIAFSPGNSEKVRFTAAGSVGIGTSTPTSKLQIAADGAVSAGQLLISGTTNPLKRLSIGFDTTQDIGFIQPLIEGSSFKDLSLNPYAGNVGIGTTTPVSKFAVAGNTYIGGVLTATGTVTNLGVGADSRINFGSQSGFIRQQSTLTYVGAENTDVVMFGKNIGIQLLVGGIRLNSATAALNWADTLYLYKDASNILAQRNGTSSQAFRLYNTYTDANNYERAGFNWSGNALSIGTENSGTGLARDLNFMTGNSTRLTIASTGNVGIGTTSPAGNLDIESTTGGTLTLGTKGIAGNSTTPLWSNINFIGFGSKSSGTIRVSDETGSTYGSRLGILLNDGSDRYNATERFTILRDGSVGISTTTPKSKLDVFGNLSLGAYAGSVAAPANGMIISGNVGIGTSTPVGNLDIESITGATMTLGTRGASGSTASPLWSNINFLGYAAKKSGTIRISEESATTFGSRFGILLNDGSAVDNATERFTILKEGFVGIGTTTPGSIFSVQDGSTGIANFTTATSTFYNNLEIRGSGRAAFWQVGDLIFANNFRFVEASPESVPQALILKNQNGDPLMSIDDKGNLNVTGDVCSSNLTCVGSSMIAMQDALKSLADTTYLLASSTATTSLTVQGIADDLTTSKITLAYLNGEVERLSSTTVALIASTTLIETRIVALESEVYGIASSTASSSPLIGKLATAVQSVIESTGSWFVNKFTARIAYIDRVEAKVAAISEGLEMTDKVTGQVYCVSIKNGDWNKMPGKCGETTEILPSSWEAQSSNNGTTTITVIPAVQTEITSASTTTEFDVNSSIPATTTQNAVIAADHSTSTEPVSASSSPVTEIQSSTSTTPSTSSVVESSTPSQVTDSSSVPSSDTTSTTSTASTASETSTTVNTPVQESSISASSESSTTASAGESAATPQ